jgi:hypothetical protein
VIYVTRLVRSFLTVSAIGVAAAGVALLALPDRLTAGPSLAVIFQLVRRAGLPPRTVWGIAFLALAALLVAGILIPHLERAALVTLLAAETGWALGLTAPIFLRHSANAVAVVAWLTLALTTYTVIHYSRHRRT